jgi:GR25 family glycosyltransferase involved in LPS biosynthesis
VQVVGRYINLDASGDRRLAMEAQFARAGCADRYSRFRAVDGTKLAPAGRVSRGEFGCFMSHYHCINDTASGDAHIHIVEDDVVLPPQCFSLIAQIQDDIAENFDLLFTDVFVPLNANTIFNLLEFYRATGMIEARSAPPEARMPHSIMFPNLHPIAFTGATSYIVNRDSRHKVRRLLDEELDYGGGGPGLPIDECYRSWIAAGRLRALCTMPFLTSIRPESISDTTIVGRRQDPATAFAYYLLRSIFYVAKDEAYILEQARALTADVRDPGYLDGMLEVFRFLFSEKFVQF